MNHYDTVCTNLKHLQSFQYGYFDAMKSGLNAISHHGWLGKLRTTVFGVTHSWGICGRTYNLFPWHNEEEQFAAVSYLSIGC